MSRTVTWGLSVLSSVANINSQGKTILNCKFHSFFSPHRKQPT